MTHKRRKDTTSLLSHLTRAVAEVKALSERTDNLLASYRETGEDNPSGEFPDRTNHCEPVENLRVDLTQLEETLTHHTEALTEHDFER